MTSLRHAVTAVGLVVLLALSGCGSHASGTQTATKESSSIAPTPYRTQTKSACAILTQKVAKSVLGGVAEGSPPGPETGNANVRISSCVRVSSLAKLAKSGSVSLVVHSAQNSTGAQTNAEAFAPESMPRNGQKVAGYGEKAFWNPTLGQLNILHEGNWYVVASGPITPSKHTLPDTKKLADALADDL